MAKVSITPIQKEINNLLKKYNVKLYFYDRFSKDIKILIYNDTDFETLKFDIMNNKLFKDYYIFFINGVTFENEDFFIA